MNASTVGLFLFTGLNEMTRQQRIDKIYEVIGEHIEVFQWPDSPSAVQTLPVMIGDVLDWMRVPNINNNRIAWQSSVALLFNLWKTKRKPIEDQPDSCVDFIYSLLPQDDNL